MKKAKTHHGPERRHTFRKSVGFHIDIVRVNDLTFKSKWHNEVGTDIGLSGVGIRCSKPLPKKANVTIAILLRGDGFQLLKVDAKLAWIKKIVEDKKERYFMGFEFTKLDPENQEKIRHYLRDDC